MQRVNAPGQVAEPSAGGGSEPLVEARGLDPNAPVVELTRSQLPAFCPNPSMPLWSSHPRVYLDLADEGEVACPYCSTRYRLKGDGDAPEPPPESHRDPASREAADLAADERGNSTLEMITLWLRGRR